MKNDLFTRGYTYDEFRCLDEQMSGGSRQLLLAFGWLIYQMKFIDILMDECVQTDSILDFDDTSPLYQNSSAASASKSSATVEEKTLTGQVKQAMRVNSKLRFGLRRLHGLVIENAHLQHQVRSGPNVNEFTFLLVLQIHQCHNMSALEAYLCQHPHLLSHVRIPQGETKLNAFFCSVHD